MVLLAAETTERFRHSETAYTHARFSNPTVTMFQERVATLEGEEAGMAPASGMAVTMCQFAEIVVLAGLVPLNGIQTTPFINAITSQDNERSEAKRISREADPEPWCLRRRIFRPQSCRNRIFVL